ncbi:MAG TPA: cytochrome P460 family protein [Blastocatellia bacterium]|nr:cytochrome P460 family protein [Blastocatellia bacterium]
MTKRTTLIVFVALTTLAGALNLRAAPGSTVAYPAGYRQWVHVKSVLVGPKSPMYESYGGLRHLYANEKAMEGYRTGRFPDGSVIVIDLFEIREKEGTTTEGPRRLIDVMEKDSRRFAETGGWAFERFLGDSQTERGLTAQARVACYNCHSRQSQKGRDFVYSTFRK